MSGSTLSNSSAINTTATDLLAVSHKASNKPSHAAVWMFGLIFVTVIGLCSVFGILLMRCLKKSLFNRFITFFVSVGVGSLSGSAVFHLLPHAFGLDEQSDYLMKSFSAAVGIYIFFFCDKLIKILLETRKRSIKKTSELKQQQLQLISSKNEEKENGHLATATDTLLHQHNHNQQNNCCNNTGNNNTNNANNNVPNGQWDHQRVTATDGAAAAIASNTEGSKEQKESELSMELQSHALCVHDHEYKEGDSVIATVAWMIIFGDGLHNLMDGVIIGAAFTETLMQGISVSVAVLCEEFPHELGDVAILVNSGMSMKEALVYNLLSALTCYVGFFIGVFVGNVGETTSFGAYTHGFAGGMFLYISLACMMPEMKNAMEKALTVSLPRGLEVLGLQALGVFTGLSCMFVMACYGNDIRF